MKRVITGHDASGKSIFTQEGPSPRILEPLPGHQLIELWKTKENPTVPDAQDDPVRSLERFVPDVGGTQFRIFTIPPDGSPPQSESEREELQEAFRTAAEMVPGLGETLELDNPGMHTTDTIDYIVAISGRVDLELDEGAKVSLQAGDCVVQRGTRHAWRNPHDEPFVAAAIMIGAHRR